MPYEFMYEVSEAKIWTLGIILLPIILIGTVLIASYVIKTSVTWKELIKDSFLFTFCYFLLLMPISAIIYFLCSYTLEKVAMTAYVFHDKGEEALGVFRYDKYYVFDRQKIIPNDTTNNRIIFVNNTQHKLWIYSNVYYPQHYSITTLKYPPLPNDIVIPCESSISVKKIPDTTGELPKQLRVKEKQRYVTTLAIYNDSLFEIRRAYREWRSQQSKKMLEQRIETRTMSDFELIMGEKLFGSNRVEEITKSLNKYLEQTKKRK